MMISFLIVSLFALPIADENLLARMPADGSLEGWAAVSRGEVFNGGALFRQINGGAELFLEHGFSRMALRDYRKGEREVRIEIYEMNEPAGAQAVFAENSQGIPPGEGYGEQCTLDPFQIVFLRGKYYVTVTCFEPDDEVERAMVALATEVDGNLHKP